MSDFRILDYNYCFEDATRLEASSSDPAFPVTNLSNILRTKVWRSSGRFVIDSSNNKIDFEDSSGGAELTATLIDGEYTPEALATHIGARMTLAGASTEADTYTCTYSSSTGRWTIATSGSYLSILWDSGTNTANSIGDTIGFDAATDSTGATTYTGPKIAIHTSERVTIDLGNTQAIDSFAICFHPFVGSKFSSGATVKLQANAHPVWNSPSVDQSLTYDDRYNVITHFFTANQSYRYWSIEVVDPQNPNLYVEIPTVLLAKATELTQLPSIGFTQQATDFSLKSMTPYGQVYIDQNPIRRRVTWPYSTLGESDLEALLDVFSRVGTAIPIGVALDAEATVFDKDRFFIYGTIVESIESEHVFYDLFNSGFTVEETL